MCICHHLIFRFFFGKPSYYLNSSQKTFLTLGKGLKYNPENIKFPIINVVSSRFKRNVDVIIVFTRIPPYID